MKKIILFEFRTRKELTNICYGPIARCPVKWFIPRDPRESDELALSHYSDTYCITLKYPWLLSTAINTINSIIIKGINSRLTLEWMIIIGD